MSPETRQLLLDIATIIGGFLGIPALIVGIVSLIVSSRRKRLSYVRVGYTKFSIAEKKLIEAIKVDFDRAKDVYIRIFDIVNNGHEPITSSDFDKPLRLAFGTTTNRTLIVRVDDTQSTFVPEYTFTTNCLEIKPTLFNPGDSVRFEVLISVPVGTYDGSILTYPRIQGIRSIRRTESADVRRLNTLSNIGCILIPVMILLLGGFSVTVVQGTQARISLLLFTLFVAILVVTLTIFLLSIGAIAISWIRYRTFRSRFSEKEAVKLFVEH